MTTIEQARARATELRAKAEQLSAPHHPYETDMATVSGIRRRPNPRADRARFARYDREGAAWAAAAEAERQVELLERRAAHAAATVPVPFTAAELTAARVVRDRHGWHKVARVNAKSVSVETGYSWVDRIALTAVLEVRS